MIKKPAPMPKKPTKPVMLPKGMAKGGMAKAKGMAYGGMTEKPMGRAKGDMAKPGYGMPAPMPGKGVRPMPMPERVRPMPMLKTGMAKGGMTKKGKK